MGGIRKVAGLLRAEADRELDAHLHVFGARLDGLRRAHAGERHLTGGEPFSTRQRPIPNPLDDAPRRPELLRDALRLGARLSQRIRDESLFGLIALFRREAPRIYPTCTPPAAQSALRRAISAVSRNVARIAHDARCATSFASLTDQLLTPSV